MRRLVLAGVLLLAGVSVLSAQSEVNRWANVDFAWYPANLGGYNVEDFSPIDYSTVQASELPAANERDIGGQGFEAKAVVGQEMVFPFLQGESPLTSANNVKVSFTGEISPVSIGAGVKTTITPLALLSFSGSLFAGSGWTVAGLNGLSLNTADDPRGAGSLEGVILDADLGATLQFDFGVLVPGDWTHVVTVYNPSLQYRYFTAAGSDQAWEWQADGGENFNGWNWKQTAVLGYQMPAVELVNTIGILLETEQRITKRDVSTLAEGGWGSDFMKTNFGPIAVFTFGSSHQLTMQVQFARERDYSEETIGYQWFRNREVETDSPTYWYFRRIAFSYRYGF